MVAATLSCAKTGSSGSGNDNHKELKVLVYTKAASFRHESIEAGRVALKDYFESNGISTAVTDDSTWFVAEKLNDFDVIVFLLTTGTVLDSMQKEAFKNFIRSGKGFAGIHSASDTEYDWPWYGGLVGAYFKDHPQIQQATLVKVDTSHRACKHLPERWTRTDEWYNFKETPAMVNILLTVDESTYQGGSHGAIHPISWCHTYDGGRSFYTAMGHTVETYKDTLFLKHVMEGIKWAGKEY